MKITLPEHPPKGPEPKIISLEEVRSRTQNSLLTEAHSVFRKWLGQDFDIQLLNIILASAAGNLVSGDPLWLMIVGGSGSGKTEVARSLEGCGAYVVSSISSEGALLSGSKKKEHSKDATGGILKEIGKHGLLVLKDFTTILSMPDRTSRPIILAALREIHDGKWVRTLGTEGGLTLTWEGHLGIIGCCTTAWDTAHTAISTMGDRFIVVRVDGRDEGLRMNASKMAIKNSGKEEDMRSDLKQTVQNLLKNIMPDHQPDVIPEEVEDIILRSCNVAAKARTPTDYDHKGRITYSHDPEFPTRLAKSLKQMIRGALSLGISQSEALNMIMRCIRDSIPPIRLECLEFMSRNADCRILQIANATKRPWNAVDKAVQALVGSGTVFATYYEDDKGKRSTDYNLAPDNDVSLLWTKVHSLQEAP